MTEKVGSLSDFDRADQRIMRAIFALLLCVTGLIAFHQWTDRDPSGRIDLPIIRQQSVILQGDLKTGTTISTPAGETLTFLPKGEGGFLETLATVIKRGRLTHGASQDAPIVTRLHAKTHLTVLDPETGQIYNLSSYGQDNIDHLITHLLPDQQG